MPRARAGQELTPIIYHHHEHYDGTGYPGGKAAGDIPLGARILAVADAYDAMTSTRPYRKAMCHEEALQELRAHQGTQFDPEVVSVFVSILCARDDHEPEHVLASR